MINKNLPAHLIKAGRFFILVPDCFTPSWHIKLTHMTALKKILLLVCLIVVCVSQSGCALIELPYDLLSAAVGSAVGVGVQAAQVGVAAAPYAAPFFI